MKASFDAVVERVTGDSLGWYLFRRAIYVLVCIKIAMIASGIPWFW